MKSIYIGGAGRQKRSGWKWKLTLALFIVVAVIGGVLKVSAPVLVEQWLNGKGKGKTGYAFSIRDVDLSLKKGEVTLKDVKVFNPRTAAELIETPSLKLRVELEDLIQSRERKVHLSADNLDIILSKDFSSEIDRIKASGKVKDLHLDALEGDFARVNVIEQKEDQSRTVLALNEVNVKVKEVNLLSLNKKTEFSVSSKLADGGKLSLTGKTTEAGGQTPWSIMGTFKQVPSDIFNTLAGMKLPFDFSGEKLNAEITARSENGKVIGEIKPEIDRINLVEERPGVGAFSIKRLLTDELTFSLPFTVKDMLSFQYAEIFARLKNYRRGAAAAPEKALAPVAEKKETTQAWWKF